MMIVANFISKEVQVRRAQKQKMEALNKRIKERISNTGDEETKDEIATLVSKLNSLQLPEETKRITDMEVKKLRQLGPRNQEYHVSMNYLQTIADLPWNIQDEENLDPVKAKEILERDHYGLELIKNRIIQFLAVRKV